MRSGRPSQTSSFVAMMRALAHDGVTDIREFHDPTALAMLPQPWHLMARGASWLLGHPRLRERALEDGRLDLVPLRTCALDEDWDAAHATGTRQLVVLGAGLDGRAFRLPNIGDTDVYEVDHPATQELKRKRTRGLAVLAKHHTFVAVDFERDWLAESLRAAGHQPDAPTFWIWEGVTPYLTRAAQKATLSAVTSCSATGTRIAMTYVVPAYMIATRGVLGLVGEPFIGVLRREEAADLMRDAGFGVVEDTGADDWIKRYTERTTRPSRIDFIRERIVLGERRGV